VVVSASVGIATGPALRDRCGELLRDAGEAMPGGRGTPATVGTPDAGTSARRCATSSTTSASRCLTTLGGRRQRALGAATARNDTGRPKLIEALPSPCNQRVSDPMAGYWPLGHRAGSGRRRRGG
jgi:hypothetical protein